MSSPGKGGWTAAACDIAAEYSASAGSGASGGKRCVANDPPLAPSSGELDSCLATLNRHFARLGDAWKHPPLAELLRLNPPLQYWETHAGSAVHPLSESPDRLHGALRFLREAPAEPHLADCAYLQVLRQMPQAYPGSPMLAMLILSKAGAMRALRHRFQERSRSSRSSCGPGARRDHRRARWHLDDRPVGRIR
jgi:hypothetical protein